MGVADVLAVLKTAAEVAEKTKNLDLKDSILSLRESIQEIREENAALKEENAELTKKFSLEKELKFDGGVYWRLPVAGEKEGPFCSTCWDTTDTLIHLHAIEDLSGRQWQCKVDIRHSVPRK